jgi:hypothetical protein
MSNTAIEGHSSPDSDFKTIFRCSLGYGLVGALVSVPLAIWAFSHLFSWVANAVLNDDILLSAVFISICLLIAWTFVVPVIASALLILAARLAGRGDPGTPDRFSKACKFVQMGGIFSVFVVGGVPLSVGLTLWIIHETQMTFGVIGVVYIPFGLSFLAIAYYVVQVRIRRVHDRLDRISEQGPD